MSGVALSTRGMIIPKGKLKANGKIILPLNIQIIMKRKINIPIE